jgi:hypothetical protein
MKPTMNKITAITKKMYAKFELKPATPPKPRKLASKAITAKMIAHLNIIYSFKIEK